MKMDKVLETLKEDYALRASLKRKHLKVQDELEDEIDDLEQSLITSKIIPELEQYAKTLLSDLECKVYLAIKKDANGDVEVADELSFIPTHTPQLNTKTITQPITSSATSSGVILITPQNTKETMKRGLRITVNGKVFQEKNAIQTFIEALKYIGLYNVAKVGIYCSGYNLVDTKERKDGGRRWQQQEGEKWVYVYFSNPTKAQYLFQIADFLKVIEIEDTPDKYDCIHYAYQGLGETDKAIAAIDTIIARNEDKKGNYYDAACLYSRMKNKDKALEYLEKCLEMGYNRFSHIRIDHDMDFIRDTPEFKALITKYETATKIKFSQSSNHTSSNEEVTTEVPFTKENGICNVKCRINDLPLYFIFDTGASTVSLSMVEATFMMKNGYLDKKDVVGSQYFQDANGNISEGTIINIKNVDFGGLKLENVKASVVRNQKAPLLLGQSVLSRLGKIEIDNSKHVLRISQKSY